MWWLLLVLGCEQREAPSVQDQRAYRAARCAAIIDTELRRECWVMSAGELSRGGDRDAAEALCAQLEDPTWKSECRFLVIDQADLLGEEAVAACKTLEKFEVSCRNHAYERHTRYHLPLVAGEEDAWRVEADALIDVYLTHRAPDIRERRVEDALLRLVVDRMEDGVFDAHRCGSLSMSSCGGVYALMLSLRPDDDVSALCAPPRSLASVTAAGGVPWTEGSEPVAQLGLAPICDGPPQVDRMTGRGMSRPGHPPEH